MTHFKGYLPGVPFGGRSMRPSQLRWDWRDVRGEMKEQLGHGVMTFKGHDGEYIA